MTYLFTLKLKYLLKSLKCFNKLSIKRDKKYIGDIWWFKFQSKHGSDKPSRSHYFYVGKNDLGEPIPISKKSSRMSGTVCLGKML